MICMLSLFGIFQTALIVGVLSEALVIPPDEKRILASVEKQREFQSTKLLFLKSNTKAPIKLGDMLQRS